MKTVTIKVEADNFIKATQRHNADSELCGEEKEGFWFT